MRVCPRCCSIYFEDVVRCGVDGELLQEQEDDPLIGRVLDGRYQILDRIGQGAMASIYHARHTTLEHEYAIKILIGDLGSNRTVVERFRREAQWVSKMQHPNVVKVSDFGTTSEGLTYLAMEHVKGRTLNLAIKKEAPFEPRRAAQIAREVASGLAEAHRLGFVHRDLKPSNIMLSSEMGFEFVKILDFGIASLVCAEEDSARLTGPGKLVGTPLYMAPEQMGDVGVGPPADFYSLGIVLYELLSGAPPFNDPNVGDLLVKHHTEQPPELPACGGLEILTGWLLEKNPLDRPQTAAEVIAEIDRLAHHDEAQEMGENAASATETVELNIDGEVEALADVISDAVEAKPPTGDVSASSLLIEDPVTFHGKSDAKEQDFSVTSWEGFGERLVEGSSITQEQLDEARKVDARSFGEALVESGVLTPERLVRALSKVLDVEVCEDPLLSVHERVLARVPARIASEHRAVPFALRKQGPNDLLFVAIADPFDQEARRAVEASLPESTAVAWLLASPTQISIALEKHYKDSGAGS